MNSKRKLISVVIPARNEERWIETCLRSLHRGSTPRERYEVILADNGSVDRTIEIAEPLVDRVLQVNGDNVSQLRNAAVAEATGEILAFLDADCIPSGNWLEAGIRSLGDEENCIAGATYRLPKSPAPVEELWFSLEPKPKTREIGNFVPAGNFFIHREFFNEVGGFDESLEAGEDKELCARVAREGAVYHDPAIRVVHEGNPKSYFAFFKRERWHGRGIWQTLRRNPRDKMVLATLLFVLGVLSLLAAIPSFFFSSLVAMLLLLAGAGAIVCVLLASVMRHRSRLKGVAQFTRVTGLYLVYFAGRGVALFSSLLALPYYHNLTSSSSEAAGEVAS